MAEYIDRYAIMQKFADRVKQSNNSDFVSVPTWNEAVQIVEAFHAADVRPVVHGKWERKRDKCGSFVSCSVCHTSGWYQFAFCPYCGADMRKEGGEKDV